MFIPHLPTYLTSCWLLSHLFESTLKPFVCLSVFQLISHTERKLRAAASGYDRHRHTSKATLHGKASLVGVKCSDCVYGTCTRHSRSTETLHTNSKVSQSSSTPQQALWPIYMHIDQRAPVKPLGETNRSYRSDYSYTQHSTRLQCTT